MDKQEAMAVLTAYLAQYRSSTYTELIERIGGIDAQEVAAPSGASFQIEVEVFWDHQPGGEVRVLGSIDDGGLRSAFCPPCAGFAMAPDGRFVGE